MYWSGSPASKSLSARCSMFLFRKTIRRIMALPREVWTQRHGSIAAFLSLGCPPGPNFNLHLINKDAFLMIFSLFQILNYQPTAFEARRWRSVRCSLCLPFHCLHKACHFDVCGVSNSLGPRRECIRRLFGHHECGDLSFSICLRFDIENKGGTVL